MTVTISKPNTNHIFNRLWLFMESIVIRTVFIRSILEYIKREWNGYWSQSLTLCSLFPSYIKSYGVPIGFLRAFQRRFTLNPKRFNINRHSNSIQKPSNLLHFGNIWKILKICQNRSYNYHIITYLHRQNWQTMFFSYFYKSRRGIVGSRFLHIFISIEP